MIVAVYLKQSILDKNNSFFPFASPSLDGSSKIVAATAAATVAVAVASAAAATVVIA